MGKAFIVTNLFTGSLTRTYDETKANDLSHCEDYFVYSVSDDKWLQDGELVEIYTE